MSFHGSGINTRQAGVDAGYNNYNSAGLKEDVVTQKGNEGVRELQQIPVGKTFQGEVRNISGEQVSIRLNNGQYVQARLGEQMNFNIGDKILFQVKSNGGSLIEIKPVMIALQGQEGAILRALEAAKLPINDKTVALLCDLLKEQMPINKENVQKLYKQILANSQADIHTIVTMNKLKIPVTKENVGQFEAYKSYEHRIAMEAEQLSGQLADLLLEVSKENPSDGKQLHMQLLQLLSGLEEAATDEQHSSIAASQNENIIGQDGNGTTEQLLLGDDGEMQRLWRENAPENVSVTDFSSVNRMSSDDGIALAVMEENQKEFSEGEIGRLLSEPERQSLLSMIQELPLSEELKNQIVKGDARVSDVLKQLHIQLQQNTQFEAGELIQNGGYRKLLRSQLQQQWFMKPEQLAAGERMEDFYEKLKGQTQQMESLLQAFGKTDSLAAQTAKGMQENIEFMNQINQMFTYVQIPLKMSGKTAHSDLYVFTKKKNLKEQDGKVSALLHLDMEELGSLDVYVELDGMDVRTQFQLPKENLVSLFQQNMDFLTRRITEKGYRFSSKVELSEKKVDFVEDFLQRDHGNAPMQRFVFDVRA